MKALPIVRTCWRGILIPARCNRALWLVAATTVTIPWSVACRAPEPDAEKETNPSAAVIQTRMEKDRAFKFGSDSPIPQEDRSRFQSLAYYPVDRGYRFQVVLKRYPRPESVRMATNTGAQRDALRYGYFEFEIAAQHYRLQVYRTFENLDSTGSNLFIPFRDATSGNETYAAGRYLDLHENTTGEYTLDFNLSYNPYCVYSETFSCPFAPRENHLQVAIRAGEKDYVLPPGPSGSRPSAQ